MQGEQADLVTVGWAYGVPEAAIALSQLESHGIKAFPQSWYMLTVDWTLSHALGGIAICVPASQRSDALQILADFVPTRRKRPIWWLLGMVLIWGWLGFPPPPSGFALAGPRPVQARTAEPLPEPA